MEVWSYTRLSVAITKCQVPNFPNIPVIFPIFTQQIRHCVDILNIAITFACPTSYMSAPKQRSTKNCCSKQLKQNTHLSTPVKDYLSPLQIFARPEEPRNHSVSTFVAHCTRRYHHSFIALAINCERASCRTHKRLRPISNGTCCWYRRFRVFPSGSP